MLIYNKPLYFKIILISGMQKNDMLYPKETIKKLTQIYSMYIVCIFKNIFNLEQKYNGHKFFD